MLVPVLNSRSTFLCLSSCPSGSQSWLDSGSYTDCINDYILDPSLCCSFGTNFSFPLCFVCLCPCVRVAAKTLLSNLLNIFSQSQWQEVHLPTMTYRACIFVLTDLSKTKRVELFENAWDDNIKLLPPNLHPPHFPQQITPFPRHFSTTPLAPPHPSPFTSQPFRCPNVRPIASIQTPFRWPRQGPIRKIPRRWLRLALRDGSHPYGWLRM